MKYKLEAAGILWMFKKWCKIKVLAESNPYSLTMENSIIPKNLTNFVRTQVSLIILLLHILLNKWSWWKDKKIYNGDVMVHVE